MYKKLKLGSSRVAIIAAIAFWVIAVTLLLHRFYSFYSSYTTFDQGIFNQVFWNGIHGNLFQSSLSSSLSASVVQDGNLAEVFYHRLGQHFTPALLLWLPIYAIFPSPATLVVLQVTLITAAGLVLYRLARQYLDPPLSLLITLSFYASNAVIGPMLANFHDLCQLPLFMFGLLLALEKRWWWLFSVLAVLILAIREDTGAILFGVGFYLIVSRRYPRIGLAVCALSLSYFLAVTNLIMPMFSQDISRRFMIEQFGDYVGGKPASTLDVIWAIISNPWRLLVRVFTPFSNKVRYLLGQSLPLALVPLISPGTWMVAGVPLLQLFLRDDRFALSLNMRFALTVVPGLFYGAILWWSQYPKALKPMFRRFWIACICVSLVLTFAANPHRTWSFLIPDSFKPWVYISPSRQWQHAQQIRSFLQQIPPDASVSTTFYLMPHLSGRREIVPFPTLQLRNDRREVIAVDYAIVDLWQLQQHQVAFRDEREKLQSLVPAIDRILSLGEYGIIGCRDGVIFLRRGVPSDPSALADWTAFRQELQPILQPSSKS